MEIILQLMISYLEASDDVKNLLDSIVLGVSQEQSSDVRELLLETPL